MPHASDLTAHTGYLLRVVSNAVSHAFARKLAGAGVTVAEWATMRTLYDGALAPSALAGTMGLTKGAISKLADRLLRKDLVTRTGNPNDKRTHSLTLTAKGRALVPVLAGLADANDAEYFGVLSAHDHETLVALLRALIEKQSLGDVPLD